MFLKVISPDFEIFLGLSQYSKERNAKSFIGRLVFCLSEEVSSEYWR